MSHGSCAHEFGPMQLDKINIQSPVLLLTGRKLLYASTAIYQRRIAIYTFNVKYHVIINNKMYIIFFLKIKPLQFAQL